MKRAWLSKTKRALKNWCVGRMIVSMLRIMFRGRVRVWVGLGWRGVSESWIYGCIDDG